MKFSKEMTYRKIKKLHRKIIDLINIPSLSRTHTTQAVEVDLTDRNKIIEMARFCRRKCLERDKEVFR
jgi:hypothetical protein